MGRSSRVNSSSPSMYIVLKMRRNAKSGLKQCQQCKGGQPGGVVVDDLSYSRVVRYWNGDTQIKSCNFHAQYPKYILDSREYRRA